MNAVPLAFCDHLCDLLYWKGIWSAKKLSGNYGRQAQLTTKHRAYYKCAVKDGIEDQRCLQYEFTRRKVQTPEEIGAASKKYVQDVFIHSLSKKSEKVSLEIIKRFPFAQYHLALFSSSFINEAWVDFAYSLKRLRRVWLPTKMDEDALRLFQKLVTGKKLPILWISPNACEGRTMDVLKTLLCQEQFEELKIRNITAEVWTTTPVSELLQFWSENSAKLRGKYFVIEYNCRSGIKQLQEFVLKEAFSTDRELNISSLHKVLKASSKEECDFIDKEYRHNFYTFATPSCVYKYDEGDGAKQKRLYLSFDCDEEYYKSEDQWRPTSYDGRDDLSLIRFTFSFRILFA
uniref:F-box domain-containing protein n=1 Tax=Steinernema glaseri TaxID=37863 RepID=A0A1I7YQ65_9BILA